MRFSTSRAARRIATIGCLVGLLCLVPFVTGCSVIQPKAAERAFTPPVIGTLYVVHLDLSKSTLEQRRGMMTDVSSVIDHLKPGDYIVVMDVSADSLQSARTLEETRVAVYNAPRAPDTSQDSIVIATSKTKAFEAQAARAKAAFDKAAGVEHVRTVLMRHLESHILHDVSSGSDLIGAVNASIPYIRSWPDKAPKVLVVLSDMQYRAEGVDLQKTPLPSGKVAKVLKREQSQGRVPTLGPSCQVYMSGARASLGTKQYQSIGRFWTAYYRRTGADVRFYGSRIPRLMFSDSADLVSDEGR